MIRAVLAALALLAPTGVAALDMPRADIVILGEVHDNPGHHARQAALLDQIAPRAVVYEMLSPDEAARLDALDRDAAVLAQAARGMDWTNLSDYAAVLVASPRILGAAVPRDRVRAAFADGAARVFGTDADVFGLTDALPEAQLAARKQVQFAAHCEAMPLEMMGGMVEAQRLRDAAFARAVMQALETYGAPVVLITGNGHARRDWGVPVYLERVAPGHSVFVLGQGEDGRHPDGLFDDIADSPAPARDDPCAALTGTGN